MDPFSIISLVILGIGAIGKFINSESEKKALKEQKSLQQQQYEQNQSTLKKHWEDQERIFTDQTEAFKGSQAQAISMSGVSAKTGSPLQAQLESARKIDQDRAAMENHEEMDFNALEANKTNADLELDRQIASATAAPWFSLLGSVSTGLNIANQAGVFNAPPEANKSNINSNSTNKKSTTQFGTYGKKRVGFSNIGSGYVGSGVFG